MPDRTDWRYDLQAMLKGWQVLIKGKLYYDQETKQYYDGNMRKMTYGEVQSRHNFDPMRPQEIYAQTAQVSPRTQQIMDWQPTEGVPTGVPAVTEADTERAEQERLAAQMGISVQDLLRYQYGVPVEEEAGLTPYQQWQTGFQERQFEWQRGEAEREQMLARQGLAAERTQMASLRYAGALSGGLGGGGSAEARRRSQETVWQDWQSRLLGELDPERDWVQRWQLSQQQNPYAPKDESPFDYAQELKADYEYAKERADYYRKKMKDPDDPLTRPTRFEGSEQVPAGAGDWTPEQGAAMGWIEREATLSAMYEKEMETPEVQMAFSEKARRERGREVAREAGWGADYGGREERVPLGYEGHPTYGRVPFFKHTTPATPAFLGEVYPELGARLPRDKAQAPMYPLSGQQWGRMLPSQRQQWAGYIGWAGGKPEDVYAQMEQMRPQYRPGARWSPARQM